MNNIKWVDKIRVTNRPGFIDNKIFIGLTIERIFSKKYQCKLILKYKNDTLVANIDNRILGELDISKKIITTPVYFALANNEYYIIPKDYQDINVIKYFTNLWNSPPISETELKKPCKVMLRNGEIVEFIEMKTFYMKKSCIKSLSKRIKKEKFDFQNNYNDSLNKLCKLLYKKHTMALIKHNNVFCVIEHLDIIQKIEDIEEKTDIMTYKKAFRKLCLQYRASTYIHGVAYDKKINEFMLTECGVSILHEYHTCPYLLVDKDNKIYIALNNELRFVDLETGAICITADNIKIKYMIE